MASSVVSTCYPTLPFLGQLNRKPHARFLLSLSLVFSSLPSLSLSLSAWCPAMIGALYVHKNQISLFVICNFLSFFILYVNGQFFSCTFLFCFCITYRYIYIVYVYVFLAEVRALLLRQTPEHFLASLQRVPPFYLYAPFHFYYINAASIVRWLAIENVTCMRHGGREGGIPYPYPHTLPPYLFAKIKKWGNQEHAWFGYLNSTGVCATY